MAEKKEFENKNNEANWMVSISAKLDRRTKQFCTVAYHPIRFVIFFYFCLFRHDFVRAISLEPLLAETPN